MRHLLLLPLLFLTACEGPMGPAGPRGLPGPEGPAGTADFVVHRGSYSAGVLIPIHADPVTPPPAIVYLRECGTQDWAYVGSDPNYETFWAWLSGDIAIVDVNGGIQFCEFLVYVIYE